MNVLIIEDDVDTAETARRILESSTDDVYKVSVVATLADGEKRLAAGDINAVLLDLSLPDGKGRDVVAAIADAAGDVVPVIVITGWSQAEKAAFASGADEVLKKPVDPLEVKRLLQYHVIHRRVETEKAAIEAPIAEIGLLLKRIKQLIDKNQPAATPKTQERQ